MNKLEALSNEIDLPERNLTAKDFAPIEFAYCDSFNGTTIETYNTSFNKPVTFVRTASGWEIQMMPGEEAKVTPPTKKVEEPSFLNKPHTFDKTVWEAGATPFKVSSWNGRGP